ncbi:TPA: hypothetical protein N0F65_002507 [Lagenidium giganteum]|uniref:Uncharacterized protein n=1 Tax=Lagenidium giganteum TaxID=4803 RepID=A0AAV2YS53_9STRA|nr:TPA: hypothetical protein N0F65_002507 [Lagenidium giganteum]
MTKATKRRRDSNSDSDGEDAASVKQARVQPTQEIRSVDGGDDATDDAGLRVAVLVPFRANHAVQARQVQLDQFVPHMTAYMKQLTRIR